jgi:hypothetical protein
VSFKTHVVLEQVQDYEKGPTYRMSLWFPMVQQLAKVTLVSWDSAPFTKAVGTLYLFSFLPIEGCLLRARTPLRKDDRAEAMELLRKWGRVERVLPNEWSLLTPGAKLEYT